ncbi:Ras family protein [Trichomonas vaginalis G3]|uniref:Ras family protein n=1 Tax=Trichomonas vaginalis (strain ATCC PRA-98 / G3) TaxID=412133 RepID=A2EVM8_TRIV3|nr:Golgi to endosome transport [Trichomonas vaginalis G3]EAY03307.1 Ras family protein [Trichomonas vaginalis G3]KAI5531762.1 Golgi to endosome transport [Trichomonas vaginalis G3]|eukprot:XP_001315530.1 Ras family protein [Trichomonas vaginalis G3]
MHGEPDYRFKVVVIGAPGSGKTAIVDQLIEKKFNEKPKTTVGVDYRPYRVEVEEFVLQLELWDTAGQEAYKAVAKTYFRDAVGCVLVFDVTSQNSFDELSFWLTQYRELADPKSVIILVGNKVDLANDRVISQETGENYAKSGNMLYYETSAVTAQNIQDVFQKLGHDIFKLVRGGEMFVDQSGHATTKPQEKKTAAQRSVELTAEMEGMNSGCAC